MFADPHTNQLGIVIDANTGHRSEDFGVGLVVNSRPVFGADDTIYFSGWDPWKSTYGFIAVDTGTRLKKWEFYDDRMSWQAVSAIGPDGTIYTASPYRWDNDTSLLLALEGDAQNRLRNNSWPMLHRNARNTAQMPTAPRIGSPLQTEVSFEGKPVLLSVLVGGEPLPEFQWFFNGQPLPGATNCNYRIASASAADEGAYMFIASNELGSVTNPPTALGVYNVAVSSHTFGLAVNGPQNTPVDIEVADKISGPWTVWTNLTSGQSQSVFLDYSASGMAQRYYRVRQPAHLESHLYPNLTFEAPVGTHYRVEYVSAAGGFTNWQLLTNLTLPSSPYRFTDTNNTQRSRFYRTTRLP